MNTSSFWNRRQVHRTLLLSLFVAALALRTGRTIVLHGIALLVVFAIYLFTPRA